MTTPKSTAETTTDHEEIRKWVEERKGKPACVKTTGDKNDVGLLRVEYPGYKNADDENLLVISWEEFFEKFEHEKLAFLKQDETADGEQSRFSKLVAR